MRHVAVKVDMVSSRLLQQRGEVQRRFLDIAGEINDRFGEHLVAEFVVTHGDEAQVLLAASQASWVFRVCEYVSLALAEVEFRFGVGFGTLSTELQPISIGMDGEAWQNAEVALTRAKRKRLHIAFCGFGREYDLQLEALGNLLCHLQARWTPEQMETIRLQSRLGKQVEVTAALGISKAAVSKRLTAAGGHHYSRGRVALARLLLQAVESLDKTDEG